MKYIEIYKCYVTQEVFLWTSLSIFPKETKLLLSEMQEEWPSLTKDEFEDLLNYIRDTGWVIIEGYFCIAVSLADLHAIQQAFEDNWSLNCNMELPKRSPVPACA